MHPAPHPASVKKPTPVTRTVNQNCTSPLGGTSATCGHMCMCGHKRPYLSPPSATLVFQAHAPVFHPAPRHPRTLGTSARTLARPAPSSHFMHMRPYLSPTRATLAFRAQAPLAQPAPRNPRISGTSACTLARPTLPSHFGHRRPYISPSRATLALRALAPVP